MKQRLLVGQRPQHHWHAGIYRRCRTPARRARLERAEGAGGAGADAPMKGAGVAVPHATASSTSVGCRVFVSSEPRGLRRRFDDVCGRLSGVLFECLRAGRTRAASRSPARHEEPQHRWMQARSRTTEAETDSLITTRRKTMDTIPFTHRQSIVKLFVV
jgi:hypothetical protein